MPVVQLSGKFSHPNEIAASPGTWEARGGDASDANTNASARASLPSPSLLQPLSHRAALSSSSPTSPSVASNSHRHAHTPFPAELLLAPQPPSACGTYTPRSVQTSQGCSSSRARRVAGWVLGCSIGARRCLAPATGSRAVCWMARWGSADVRKQASCARLSSDARSVERPGVCRGFGHRLRLCALRRASSGLPAWAPGAKAAPD